MGFRINGTVVHIKHTRSMAKALSWRVIATLTTMVAVFIVSGEWLLALEVGAIEVTAKLLFYYLHERAWEGFSWGVEKVHKP